MRERIMTFGGVLLAILAFGLPAPVAAHASGDAGTVYTITNSAAGNAVVAYHRAADGTLGPPRTFPTGGLGTGSVLASQGAVALSSDGRWLATVDAGSDDVALFAVGAQGSLRLASRVSSGGTMPISVTLHGTWLYVLDAGGAGGIAGFRIDAGVLDPIAGSVRPLSGPAASTAPEQIGFSSDGHVLLVAEKGSNQLATYTVGADGSASGPDSFASAGAAPYGFAFDRHGHVFVSEAAVSALSSYAVSGAGIPTLISASVANGQAAACWTVVTPNGRFAFTIDAHNAAISSYAISADGSVRLVQGASVLEPASSIPLLDAAVTRGGRFLYVVNVGVGAIDAFRVGDDGSLAMIARTSGLPAGFGGLAAS